MTKSPSEQFPNVRALGLSVTTYHTGKPVSSGSMGDPYEIGIYAATVKAADLEALLAKGRVGYANYECGKLIWFDDEPELATHTFLAVNFQPIQRDTAEGLLRELVDAFVRGYGWSKDSQIGSAIERARKLLESYPTTKEQYPATTGEEG